MPWMSQRESALSSIRNLRARVLQQEPDSEGETRLTITADVRVPVGKDQYKWVRRVGTITIDHAIAAILLLAQNRQDGVYGILKYHAGAETDLGEGGQL